MAWNIKGSYVETCSCELMCPCNLSLDHGATYDFCRVTLVFNILASVALEESRQIGERVSSGDARHQYARWALSLRGRPLPALSSDRQP